MYNSINIAIKIKSIAKSKNIMIKNLLLECGLSINTLSNMNHGKSIAFDSLAKIADYLDCSVDYLLGRTDNPNYQTTAHNISGSVTNSAVVQGNNTNLTVNSDTPKQEISKQAAELVKIFENLDARSQMRLFSTALELESQSLNKNN